MPDDALGLAMLDRVRGCLRAPCVYRDGDETADGHVYENYLVPPERWPDEKWAFVESLRTPLLDVGCGAGQHSLVVGERGDVVAFDVSPNAVRAARERGVESAFVGDMFAPAVAEGAFETVLANGTQVSLAASFDQLAALLARFDALTTERGELVVDCYDPTRLDPDRCFGYRADPRAGVARRRFHFEYGSLRGPTLDFLLFSPDRLRDTADTVGLGVHDVTYSAPESSYYKARLR